MLIFSGFVVFGLVSPVNFPFFKYNFDYLLSILINLVCKAWIFFDWIFLYYNSKSDVNYFFSTLWFQLMVHRRSQLIFRNIDGKKFLFDNIRYYENRWDWAFFYKLFETLSIFFLF